jgi:hypothetical protein
MNRHEIETQLIEKANADPAFRQHLLDDPKGAVADLLGVALPPEMTITVLEETPGHHYLVLPPAAPAPDALPLDDLELALVGGGRTLRPFAIKCSVSNTRASASNARSSSRSSC